MSDPQPRRGSAAASGLVASGRREATKSANRQAILDAARAVFGEIGFAASSVRDIIRRTTLSVGAFYNYFPSKEAVYEALADDGARRFRPRLRAVADPAADFDAWLTGAVQAYFGFLLDEHQSLNARPSDGEARHPTVRAATPEMLAVFDEVRAAIRASVAAGGAPPVDADYLAFSLIGVAREIGEQMVERQPPDLAGATTFALAMMRGGIAALPRLSPLD